MRHRKLCRCTAPLRADGTCIYPWCPPLNPKTRNKTRPPKKEAKPDARRD